MSEGRKERSPQQLAKSRRDYLARVKMLTVDEAPRRQRRSTRRLASRRRKAPLLRRLWMRPGAPIFGCSAHWAVMPKSRPRSPASSSSSIKCNYGCWTLSHASVRQHLPRQLTPAKQARWEVSDGYLINLHVWKSRGSNSRARGYEAISGSPCSGRGSWRATTRPPPSRKVINRSGSWATNAW